ncbi:MAG: hypothetical protein KatS3mg033_0209 [Thermonema sp.]|jgi:hypothetical protein|uniref:hypothetical protein n=1 Tax=Thermonema TaxID=28194 RepID=UPI00056F5B82|nr:MULTISPECIES: hypothetical protein [Thermonema]GIV38409.1 MAG: hypothetical protein KatS3mg033_0209 [Thermonema sp.]
MKKILFSLILMLAVNAGSMASSVLSEKEEIKALPSVEYGFVEKYSEEESCTVTVTLSATFSLLGQSVTVTSSASCTADTCEEAGDCASAGALLGLKAAKKSLADVF